MDDGFTLQGNGYGAMLCKTPLITYISQEKILNAVNFIDELLKYMRTSNPSKIAHHISYNSSLHKIELYYYYESVDGNLSSMSYAEMYLTSFNDINEIIHKLFSRCNSL